jgi:bifunctional non-homologous end joining protein LigD
MVAMRPMLATAADPVAGLPTDGTRWSYEVKWDGMRVLANLHGGAVQLNSRSERDITVSFPELADLGKAHPDVLLDGEIVVLADGLPSFAALAERFHVRDARKAAALAAQAPASLIAFDVLRLYGVDLMSRPWQERREALERLAASGGHWQLSPVHEDVEALLHATQEHGLEGVVAKRRDSRYRPGARSSDWLKLAHRRTQACVIGGWRKETTSTTRIGALLLGIWTEEKDDDGVTRRYLRFAGRVGSGLVGAGPQADLHRLLDPLARGRSPFDDEIPREDAVGTTWVEPDVVIEVRYLSRTDNGRLRQPVFRGIRPDLDPQDVRPE